jgi:hypothetical protein
VPRRFCGSEREASHAGAVPNAAPVTSDKTKATPAPLEIAGR